MSAIVLSGSHILTHLSLQPSWEAASIIPLILQMTKPRSLKIK